jgi:HEPN domain-containing protein
MEFDVKKTVAYWSRGAKYDLGVADAMFRTGKYPYALFMGHLAVEKLLKALVVKNTKTHAPPTHLLPLLAEKAMLELPASTETKLKEFMEFHFEARYPREEMAFYAKCTRRYTRENLKAIREVYRWLRKQLEG